MTEADNDDLPPDLPPLTAPEIVALHRCGMMERGLDALVETALRLRRLDAMPPATMSEQARRAMDRLTAEVLTRVAGVPAASVQQLLLKCWLFRSAPLPPEGNLGAMLFAALVNDAERLGCALPEGSKAIFDGAGPDA